MLTGYRFYVELEPATLPLLKKVVTGAARCHNPTKPEAVTTLSPVTDTSSVFGFNTGFEDQASGVVGSRTGCCSVFEHCFAGHENQR